MTAYVVASMGPLGVVLEPLGPTSVEEAEDFYAKNVQVFEKAGVDGYSLEGFHDLNELRGGHQGGERSQRKTDSGLHRDSGKQKDHLWSHHSEEFLALAEEMDVDALGFSGDVGPSGMLTALEMTRPLTSKPIGLLPNAGLPRYVNDQYIYLCNPDYMGKFAKRFVQAGANFVGGHSGVYEEHVKAISNASPNDGKFVSLEPIEQGLKNKSKLFLRLQ